MQEAVIRELGLGQSGAAFAAMRALRTHLSDEHAFAAAVDGLQRPQGYRLAAVFEAAGAPQAAAVAGFRITHHLAWGRTLYLDDLSTRPEARRRGHARLLLGWLEAEARSQGCDELHLDSGVGPERRNAHRLYFNAGLRIASHHFVHELGEAQSATPPRGSRPPQEPREP